MSVEGKMTLTPPNKDGKIPVKRGDTIWWFDDIPYRVDFTLSTKQRGGAS
jgi:hypothetical protein